VEAAEKKLDEQNQRLGYLDSKIDGVNQKAQISLDKWRAREARGNVFTDMWKRVEDTFGLGN
jgi:hypothetical protein